MHTAIKKPGTSWGTFFTIYELLDTTATDCVRALSSKTADYEDAVMIETAIRCGMDCIVTRNIRIIGIPRFLPIPQLICWDNWACHKIQTYKANPYTLKSADL